MSYDDDNLDRSIDRAIYLGFAALLWTIALGVLVLIAAGIVDALT